MGSSHVLSGTTVGLATAPLAVDGIAAGAAWVGLVTFATLLPDIDHHGSTITRSLGPITKVLSWALRRLSPHRGLTHSAFGLFLASFVLWWLCDRYGVPVWIAGALVTGCATHVAGDAITKAGVYFGWPFTKKRLRLFTMKAGGWQERYLVVPALFVASAWFGLQLIF